MLFPALREFHDAVYVLTIESAVERQKNTTEQLGEGNFEFVFGVDKRDVSKEELLGKGIYDEETAVETDRSGRAMTVGHVCCSLGHRMIYERFLDTAATRCLVFEDDVIVNDVSEQLIDSIVRNIPADAEFIYWGWDAGGLRPAFGTVKQAVYHVSHSMGFLKYNHTMIRNLYDRPYNEHFHVSGKHLLGHAYTITRPAAEALIRWNTPIILNADNALMYAVMNGDVRAYVSRTKLFDQRSASSSDPMQTLTA
ncbi:MAG: glycosyltransferase family 25 protein [Acidobacteria bacterium]|nr:glycosyltransferase family 25 protein [Acidobacteriota bacterium]